MAHEVVLSRFGITKEVLSDLSNYTRCHLFSDLLVSRHSIYEGDRKSDFHGAGLRAGEDFLWDEGIDGSVRADAARIFYEHNTFILDAWTLDEFVYRLDVLGDIFRYTFPRCDFIRRVQVTTVIQESEDHCQRENLSWLSYFPHLEQVQIDLQGSLEMLDPKEGEDPGLRSVAPVIAKLKRSTALSIYVHEPLGTTKLDECFDPPSDMDKQAVEMGSTELGRYYRVMIPQWTALYEATEAQDAQRSIGERYAVSFHDISSIR
ncbi:MAG: hypothetical protein M1835_001544 [Candelina submexicana]|nr:MAG: hypothetical protein M1835_001544 [Candelina submexicana]